jgi:Fe-S cluster biosynthesis and repair protein YggX
MSRVSCSRCGSSAEGLERAPLPGDIGLRVLDETCLACWQAWLAAQVMLINERKLSPAKPEDYRALLREMATFLSLRAD